MNESYETTRTYSFEELEVTSDVVQDEIDEPLNVRRLLIRSSCPSVRWGARTQDQSYACPASFPDFRVQFEEVRRRAAEVVANTELGKLSETLPRFFVPEVHGPTGLRVTPVATANLSISPTLLGPEMIAYLGLTQLARRYCTHNGSAFEHFPVYSARIKFGHYDVDTDVVPSRHGSPACIVGGDFFQRALEREPNKISELIMPDTYRALSNAARCKKNTVLILGKYAEHRSRLEKIKEAVGMSGLMGLILDEYPDIEEQSLAEKMVTFASISRFVIVEDVVPSGHITELDICHERRFVTAVLRMNLTGATTLQSDIAEEVGFMKTFTYEDEQTLKAVVARATAWGTDYVEQRARRLNRTYSDRRGPSKLL